MGDTRVIICPKCGYLGDIIIDDIDNIQCPYCRNKARITNLTPHNFYNMTNNERFDYVVNPLTKTENGGSYDPLLYGNRYRENAEKTRISQSSQPQIKCPTCSSTNVSRISTTARVTNIAMFGLLGQKRKHQFKCNSCRYEW